MESTGVYLTFDNGKCAEAFAFYESVFETKASMTMKYGGSPMEKQVPEGCHDLILHKSLNLGPKFALMGCDRNPMMHKQPHQAGNNMTVSLSPKTQKETEHIFQALSEKEGAQVTMPLAKQFWGSLFGSLTDSYGIQWMVDFGLDKKDGNDEEEEKKEYDTAGSKHSLDAPDGESSENKKAKV